MTENAHGFAGSDVKVKNRIIRFSVLTLLCFISAMLVYYLAGIRHQNIRTNKERIEKVLQLKEHRLESLIRDISMLDDKTVSFATIHEIIPADLWENEGMLLFVYKNDSLVFWSGNNVPVITRPDSGESERALIHYGNGWYYLVRAETMDLKMLGLVLVKFDFAYQNEYLRNEFHKDFNVVPQVNLDTVPGSINIHNAGGQFLFSLYFPEDYKYHGRLDTLSFILFAASLVFFLVLLFYLYHLFDFFRTRPLLLYAAFLADALIFRFILVFFEIPRFIYQTELFSPYHYAATFISPSLGDLVLNSLLWLTLAWIFYNRIKISTEHFNQKIKVLTGIVLILFTGILFYLLMATIRRMIIDSSFELNLNNIFNINIYSGLGFFAIAAQIMAFFLASASLIRIVCMNGMKSGIYLGIAVGTSVLLLPLFLMDGYQLPDLVLPALFLIYLASFLYFAGKRTGYKSITGALVYIVIFSMITTFVLDYYHGIKEKEKRKILAAELSSKRDPMMEFEFGRLKSQILGDTTVRNMLVKEQIGEEDYDHLTEYLQQTYFNSFWGNYEQLITICSEDEILEIQPGGYLVNCFEYFSDIIGPQGGNSKGTNLFFLDNRSENNNYIAVFDFKEDSIPSGKRIRIFIELFYKYIEETGLGYPDLLIDKKIKVISGLSNYSYARYSSGSLIYKFGDFSYNLGIDAYNLQDSLSYYIDIEGYNHYIQKTENNNVLIISKKNLNWLDLIAPFSYLFILLSLFLVIFLLVVMFPGKNRKLDFNFSNQLQFSIIIIIVLSFFVLGMITRSNIIHLNNAKNRDILSEKTFSVLTELEHKIGNSPGIQPEMTGYLSDLLVKFSVIFYSDINLYNTDGTLIASSRPQIFQEGLLSNRMHTEAFQRLAFEQNLLFIQNEKIGRQEYLSAYMPFRNNQDQIIAYLNLPYFAKQTEIRKEISDFLVAYINVYVLLIVLAIMITIIVSRLVTRPLQLIREKLGHIALGKTNEKIAWKRKDEIGDLVDEYNRMVDELARSAELLASSERESAWREMAKQVAHEIKNPLTPMKLSVQYLKKAWEEKAPDWEYRLDRFTKTIVEQIDSLSQIASEFSDFAKMPVADLRKIDLQEVIRDAANLYKDNVNILFIEEYQEGASFVKADKRQLLRVFNNLIQNSVQAIGTREDGSIRITVHRHDRMHIIEITDNGAGITPEQAARIFSPSFTTKTSGMGLGLAMVKSIVTSIGGTVTFTSKEGEGTTFTLQIPSFTGE